MNGYKLELCTGIRPYLMLWKTPVYKFRVPVSEESEFSNEVVIDVTGSAPSFLRVMDSMSGVWEKLLSSEEGKKIKTILDFGAAKFRNTLHFLDKGKRVTAVEFEDLPNKSDDAKEMLDKCKARPNFQHLIFPYLL